MCPVTERLIDGSAAAAEREGGLAGKVELVAVDVHQFHGALGRFDTERAIRPDGDLHLSHKREFLQPYGFPVSLRKITLSQVECLGAVTRAPITQLAYARQSSRDTAADIGRSCVSW